MVNLNSNSERKMKRLNSIYLILSLAISVSCVRAQVNSVNPPNKSKGYSISGRINNLKDTTCLLAYYSGDKRLVYDTAEVDDKGNFRFEGEQSLPGGIYMISFNTNGGAKAVEFLIGEQHFEIITDTVASVDKTSFIGSQENKIYYEKLRFDHPRRKEMDETRKKLPEDTESKKYKKMIAEGQRLQNEIRDNEDRLIDQHPESMLTRLLKSSRDVTVPKDIDSSKTLEYLQAHYFDNIDFSDSRLARTPILIGKYNHYLEKLTYQEPDSIIKAVEFILQKAMADSAVFKLSLSEIGSKYEKSKIMCMDKVMLYIFQRFYKKGYAWWVDDKTMHSIDKWITRHAWVQCGNQPPKLDFPDTNGVKHQLFDEKGKYTLVYFWSATCGHCKKMTPKVWGLYEKYKDLGFRVYAVCIDPGDEPYKTFIKKHGLNWTNVRDGKNSGYYRNKYDVFSTPRMYLLDESKRIKLKQFSFEVLEEFLEEELMAK